MNSQQALRQLVEGLQSDLRSLSSESKKRFPAVKEAAERSMMNLRTLVLGKTPIDEALAQSDSVLHAFLFGCESRQPKPVQISLAAMQKLITHRAIPESSVGNIMNTLWGLMESRMEELKILQTLMVLVSCLDFVHGELLAKAFVLCFQLHSGRDSVISNTASASVRQLVCVVFERVTVIKTGDGVSECLSPTRLIHRKSPKNLDPSVLDAYLLFQDLCQLMNGDNAAYLIGLNGIERSLGLELLETVLSNYSAVFLKHSEFSFLLKERICPLVIKLFSPSIKHRPSGSLGTILMEKPSFSVSVHLLRIVSVLIKEFFTLLVTECEIFLSLLVKFLDLDKPFWQRTMAVEVIQSFCVNPSLVCSFCKNYDMQEHSTKIFRDIITALGSFLQSLFTGQSPGSPTAISSSTVSSVSSVSSSSSNTAAAVSVSSPSDKAHSPTQGPRRGFMTGNIFISYFALPAVGAAKPVILHMLDKTEPPPVQESYALVIAMAGLQAVVSSVASLADDRVIKPVKNSSNGEVNQETDRVLVEMVNSSWCGVLAALSLLLDASLDEQATEFVLKTLCSFLRVSGVLELATPRDAFITTLCKACLPPHYAFAITVENVQASPRYRTSTTAVSTNVINAAAAAQISAKNLQCMRSLLGVVHCHGGVLGSAWYLVLNTLQHLTDILNLKAASSGSFKAPGVPESSMAKAPASGAVVDLSIVASMLSRLFEPSRFLSEQAVLNLLDALCRLSNEVLESSANGFQAKDPSLFPAAKLLEVGLANLCRSDLVWETVESHLLKVCQHSNVTLRDYASDSLTSLIRSGLNYKNDTDGTKPEEQTMVQALQKMSRIEYLDVRHQQLECVLQVLHSNGQELAKGWPILLDVLMQGAQLKGEVPIRVAFQALQLVVTDFMPLLPRSCLPLCIQTAARFGTQLVELNISLTAIGLLWNVSDFLEQNRDAIEADADGAVDADPNWTGSHLTPFERLWLCLFGQLAVLCVDDRPPVRKSACQTLFQTINTYGHVLTQKAWEPVVWKVLFPMLKEVQARSGSAADTKLQGSDGGTTRLLIHHSRDTEQKQWAETQKMALAGVARVFRERRAMLCGLDGFQRAWTCLLDVIYHCALYPIPEVSQAALKSFQAVVDDEDTVCRSTELWRHAWQTWLAIGRRCLQEGEQHTQSYLTELVKVFRMMYRSLDVFNSDDLDALAGVLRAIVSLPIDRDSSLFLTPSSTAPVPSPLQRTCLETVENIYCAEGHRESLVLTDRGRELAPRIISVLLEFSLLASRPPASMMGGGVIATDELRCTVAFGERAMRMAASLYIETRRERAMIESFLLDRMLKCLRVPLNLKYACPVQTTWQQAVDVLLRVLKASLEVISMPQWTDSFGGMWTELGSLLEDFLFSPNFPKTALPVEQRLAHEELDIKVVEMLRTDILTRPQCLPPKFKSKVMALLNRGSEHSGDDEYEVGQPSSVLVRESFAKSCFETLLHVSFMSSDSNTSEGGLSELAISTLLKRCQDVLKKFVSEERLAGRRPLPRSQMSEVAFVLKASSTVLESLKKAHQTNAGSVNVAIWRQVIDVYPCLVDCVTCVASDVKPALKEALRQFQQLLSPPAAFDVL